MISFHEILISAQNNGITVYTSHLGELDALLHRVLEVTVKPYNTVVQILIFFTMRQYFLTLIKQAHGTSVGPYGIPMITMQNVKRKSFKLALVKFLIAQNFNFITKLINEPVLCPITYK